MRLEPSGLRARPFNTTASATMLAAVSMLFAAGCNWQREERGLEPDSQAAVEQPAVEQPAAKEAAEEPARKSRESESPWGTDLTATLAEAKRLDRPVLVVSILGDLAKRC